jgi:hypothetical protein
MTVAKERQEVIELLNEALSAEYHSFIGHALNSNPFVPPGCEKDVEFLEALRDDENLNAKALLVQLGRYRAGPTLKAFRFWKEDLNFLGIDWLVVHAAEIARADVARVEALQERIPSGDAELAATFVAILETRRRHAAELATLATKRQKERDARRAAAFKATGIPLKKPAAAKPAAAAPAGAPAAGGVPKAPPLPGAPKAPTLPGAPKPPSPPLPGAPKPPSPPLPSGGPKPPSPPKPPSAPSPPKPPVPRIAVPEATTAEAAVPSPEGPKLSGPPGPNYKPTPPKPYMPKNKS